MAKYWTPGEVKTRLGAAIGDKRSAAIHRQFVLHLAATFRSTGDSRYFAVTPAINVDDFSAALPHGGWEFVPQADGDLGRRMESWFKDRLASPASAVLIGADCPTLRECDINEAFQLLHTHDVVLGPAADGGYYLMGLAGPWRPDYAALFAQIAWSTDRVYDMTIERIEQQGLQLATLPVREDIDTINEFNRLHEALGQSGDPDDQRLAAAIESILGEPNA